MKNDFKIKLTHQAFDEYLKEGDNTDFSQMEALWYVIDEKTMNYMVNTMEGGYSMFLNTVYWKTVAEEVKRRAGYRCQLCNSEDDLNVHHRCYEHKGTEIFHMNDLICLCHKCHEHHHKGRERIEDLEAKADKIPYILKANSFLIERLNRFKHKYKVLEEAKPLIIDTIPSDKAYKYFSAMNEDELRKQCMQLYDTFTVLRDELSKNVELKAELSYLQQKMDINRWKPYENFDNPPEDEISFLSS